VVLIALRRPVTITAKNVLARNPLLGVLMKGLGVVTFHRRDDIGKGADLRQNVRSLQQCRDVLARGGALCLFPEGISHSDPKAEKRDIPRHFRDLMECLQAPTTRSWRDFE
jgi:glycerol-3-phosphate O-acyltransferase / dihydroxyacetone phosphate acyltransferase